MQPSIHLLPHVKAILTQYDYHCLQDGWEPAPPNDYAMCKLGAWDREIPRCVRPGCRDPVVAEGVRAVEEMGGAIVRFYCSDPSGLQGVQKQLFLDIYTL